MIGDNWDTDMKGGMNAGMKALIWIRRRDIDCATVDENKIETDCDTECHRTTDVLDVPSLLVKIYQ